MLQYRDLPLLEGEHDEIEKAQVVRFACLRTIQKTQRALLVQVGAGRRSVQTYHRQTYALRLTMAFHRKASWWTAPFYKVEQDFRNTWGRIMSARYRIIEGQPRFVFPVEECLFARALAPLAPDLLYQEVPCARCGGVLLRPALQSVWEPLWCGTCFPTELVVPAYQIVHEVAPLSRHLIE
jgi:hypothetical protein